jgi:PAS domain S-box-containing protein
MSAALDGNDLTAKAELLEVLLNATQDGIVDWNLQTSEVIYNARWKHLLGFDSEEHTEYCDLPDAWRELMHPDDRPRTLKLIDDHLQQGWPLYTTVRMRHRHGGYRHILVRGAARRDANDTPVRLVMIFSDIDERIRAEERQRALVSAVPDTVFRVRGDGTILSLKQGMERHGSPFAGLHEGMTLGDSISDERVRARLEAALSAPGQLSQEAQTFGVSSGGPTPIYHEIRIVRSSEDELVCIVRDVTEQRGIADLLTLLDMLRATVDAAATVPPSEARLSELAQVVKRHKGSIDFETELGRGTTFVIRLPLCAETGKRGAPS